jgi:hypothetical protein
VAVEGVDEDFPAIVFEAAMKFDRTNIITRCKHDGCKYYLLSIEDDAHFASSKGKLIKQSPLATPYQPQKHQISETPPTTNKRPKLFLMLWTRLGSRKNHVPIKVLANTD